MPKIIEKAKNKSCFTAESMIYSFSVKKKARAHARGYITMLKMVVRNSKKLIRLMSSAEGIRIGRFLTKIDTAAALAAGFRPSEKSVVHLLDAGAGTGILAAAAVEEMCKWGSVSEIFLTCYENDPMFLPSLADNMERMRKRARHDYKVKVRIRICEEDFLLASHDPDERYDYIVTNPPEELYEAPHAAFALRPDVFTAAQTPAPALFALIASELLAEDGQMALTLPTAHATAVQLSAFRRRLFDTARPELLYLSAKTGKAGDTVKKSFSMLLRAGVKNETIRTLVTKDGEAYEELDPRPYAAVVREGDCALTLMCGEDEDLILSFMKSLPCTFDTFHLKVHTGLTLESRYPDLLRDKPEDGAVPLIHPRCLRDGMVVFPRQGAKGQYIIPRIPSLARPNKNILLMKRVPAKSDKRRIVSAPFLAGSSMFRYISTHNKLNFIDVDGKEQMDPPFLYGLHAFLSSEPMDRYIRIISKTAQLNARDLAALPLPTATQLRAIGAKLMSIRVYRPEYCDRVVKAELFGNSRK